MGCCASLPTGESHQASPLPSSAAPSARTVRVQQSNGNANDPSGANTQRSQQQQAPHGNGVHTSKDAQVYALSPKDRNVGKGELKGAARYEISSGVLGKGHFAVVKKARDRLTGSWYAIKIIDKKEMVKSSAMVVKQEIEILKAVGAHPNIVSLVDHYEDSRSHHLVMELCEGGDLFSQIVEHGKYSEKDAVRCCRQLATALKHIHDCGITHRDLKPENILLLDKSPESPLKLADFGLSKLIKGHLHPMRTVCGTWAYCVAADTHVLTWDRRHRCIRRIAACQVNGDTLLLDEHFKPIKVVAIHTTPQRSRAKLWSVVDAGKSSAPLSERTLFRCTADHKLSLLEVIPAHPTAPSWHPSITAPQTSDHPTSYHTRSSRSYHHSSTPSAHRQKEARRVEIRAEEFFALPPHERRRFHAYVACHEHDSTTDDNTHDESPPHSRYSSSVHSTPFLPLPSHVRHSFTIDLIPPAADAALEPYVGIEVDSETHRFLLAGPTTSTSQDDGHCESHLLPSRTRPNSNTPSSPRGSSPYYGLVTSNCAPEVIQRRLYDQTVDNWTLGVLMYILLSGYHPFDCFGDLPEPELLQKIMACAYDFDDPVWVDISDQAKSLIRGLLVLDASKRLSLDAYLSSAWIREETVVKDAPNPLVVERLSKFSVGRTKFRALVVAKMASNKFKASLSKSRQRKRAGSPPPALLPNGEPDYLGLSSQRSPIGVSSRFFEGLESVREREHGTGVDREEKEQGQTNKKEERELTPRNRFLDAVKADLQQATRSRSASHSHTLEGHGDTLDPSSSISARGAGSAGRSRAGTSPVLGPANVVPAACVSKLGLARERSGAPSANIDALSVNGIDQLALTGRDETSTHGAFMRANSRSAQHTMQDGSVGMEERERDRSSDKRGSGQTSIVASQQREQ